MLPIYSLCRPPAGRCDFASGISLYAGTDDVQGLHEHAHKGAHGQACASFHEYFILMQVCSRLPASTVPDTVEATGEL